MNSKKCRLICPNNGLVFLLGLLHTLDELLEGLEDVLGAEERTISVRAQLPGGPPHHGVQPHQAELGYLKGVT